MNSIFIDGSMPVTARIADEPIRINNVYCTEPVEPTDCLETDLKNIFTESTVVKDNREIQFVDGQTAMVHYYSDCADRIGNMKIYEKIAKRGTPCRIFVFAILHVDEQTQVIITIDGRSRSKCWINNSIIFDAQVQSFRSHSVVYDLPKGDNYLVLEVNPFDSYSIIAPRITRIDKERLSLRGEIINDYVECTCLNKYSLLFDNTDLRDNKEFSFIILPHDFSKIEKDSVFIVSVYDEQMKLLLQNEFGPLVKNSINCKPFGMYNYLYIKVSSLNSNAEYIGAPIELVLNDMNKVCDGLCERYETKKNDLSELKRINVEARIEAVRNGEDIHKNLDEINFLLNENTGECFFKRFGNCSRRIYFRSGVDYKTEYVTLTLPEQVSEKYPILLFLNTKRYDFTPDNFSAVCNRNQAVIAQISLKGVTTGGYIGETAVFETLNLIRSLISIDDDRIYLAGISNGGYATWVLSEHYPHLFAGIAPMFCSPYLPHLCNLYNTEIVSVGGDRDPLIEEGGYKTADYYKQIKKDDYHLYIMEETDHNVDYELRYSGWLFDRLFAMRKKNVPSKVLFKTNRYRYKETYYLSDVDFFDVEGGEISLSIEGDTVCIETKCIASFNLDLPPEIISQTDSIIVNQKCFRIDKSEKRQYGFVINFHGDITLTDRVFPSKTLKGIGILDVYFGSMKIVLPETYDDENTENVVNQVAKKLSRPATNGVETVLYVEYPIINSSEFQPENYCNYIFIGSTQCQNYALDNVLKSTELKLLDTGFEYQSELYECEYSILMAVPGENDEQGTNLVIYTNNMNYLKKNIFLRNFVLPSFINGMHPFLNSQVLICSDRGFERINNMGDPLEKRLANGEWLKN